GRIAGFDNNGSALSFSPLLLEDYLKVARKATNLILGLGSTLPVTEVFPATGNQADWLEGLPMGTRGGVRVRYYFPRDGDYELRAFLGEGLTPKEGVRFFRQRVPVSAGLHTFVATFPEDFAAREGAVPNLPVLDVPGLGGPLDIRGSAFM